MGYSHIPQVVDEFVAKCSRTVTADCVAWTLSSLLWVVDGERSGSVKQKLDASAEWSETEWKTT